jgi:hypothetical protein
MSRPHKIRRQADRAVGEVTGIIEDNPVTTALAALAAGAVAASLFKMNAERSAARRHRIAKEQSAKNAAASDQE